MAFTWGWEPNHKWCDPNLTVLPPGASLVEINLESREGGTLVRLRHSHVPKEIAERHRERWSHYLAQLAAVVKERESKRRNGPD